MAQDILITPGSGEPQILFRGSGTNDTPIELNVLSSYLSANGSGSALLFEGTEGQLFAITDNLSSGVIFSVADIAGLPLIEADASGDVQLIEYGRYVGVGTGTPAYQLDVFGTGRFSDGIIFPDGNTQTVAYTGPPAVITDAGTGITIVCATHANNYLRTTSNSGVTITFPSGVGCDTNSEFTFEQAGSGQITVTGAAGVTINTSSTTKSYTQFSVISLKQVATDTYTLFGDTASF